VRALLQIAFLFLILKHPIHQGEGDMHYVYILRSTEKKWHYVGYTTELKSRFQDHMTGKVRSTKNHRPFRLASYIAVENKEIALDLERYLKCRSEEY
jgi:putative endonuclease